MIIILWGSIWLHNMEPKEQCVKWILVTLAVTFKPLEFKNLGPYDSVPFVVDSQTKPRTGVYGMVEKVFEGNDSFARKTIRDNYDTEKIMIELKILRMATETENPHHLRL